MSQPQFAPKPGQIDFTHVKEVPIVDCIVKYKNKILLIQRSLALHFYPGAWDGVSGFLDTPGQSVAEKAREELHEELGIGENDIVSIEEGKSFTQDDAHYGKIWTVYPVLVEVEAETIQLNWEGEKYEWVLPKDVWNYQFVPGFDIVLETLFPDIFPKS